MKNKYFVISVVLVFLMNVLMVVTGSLTLPPFSYFLKNSMLPIVFLVILDVLTIYTVIQLIEITSRWIKRNESFNELNIKISSQIILISILITLGFNIFGIIYFIISKTPFDESLLIITSNGFVMLFIIYLLFMFLIYAHRHLIRHAEVKKN